MSVHAVILAGGLGSRLLPFTKRTPKHLLPIGDEPVIAHQLHRLSAAGVRDVVLATSYHAEAFRPVLGDGEAYGVRLRYGREASPLGTGGALRHASSALELDEADDLIVLNGDLISEHDLRAHLEAHRAARRSRPSEAAQVTIHARAVEDAGPFGLLHTDGLLVTRFEEKPGGHPAGLVNAGTYIVTPAVVARIPADAVVSLEREVFPPLASEGAIRHHIDDAAFEDIGTPSALLRANVAWAERRGRSAVALSEATAPGADVHGSLIMSGARIGQAVVRGSVIGPGACVEDGAEVIDCVIGDDAVVSTGRRLTGVTLDVGERR